jgi:hypothetical protein
MTDQSAAIARLYEHDATLLIAGVGFGKCMIAQTAAQELLDEGVLSRVLVVAPLKVCQLTWATEYRKWEQLEAPGMALGSAQARRGAIESDARIVVINIENLPWLIDTYGHQHGFDGLVIDEISKFKAAGTQGVKKARFWIKKFKWRVGLSATPVAESGTDLYAQMLLIDTGPLGRNFEKFRRQYFMQTDYLGYDWKFMPGGVERLADTLRDAVWTADDTAYKDSLPPLVNEIVEVELPEDALREYMDMGEQMLAVNDTEIPNEAVLSGKLMQLAQGAVYDGDGNASWFHWVKFDRLADLVEQIAAPVVIVYQFRFELEYLKEMYPDAAVLAEDPAGSIAAWDAGEVQILLMHPKSAAHGINLQYGGADIIHLGPLWSADAWTQCAGRLHRRGQTSSVIRWVLVAKDTVDQVILDRLEGKSESEHLLMEYLRNLK